MLNEDLSYYLGLSYTIVLEPIDEGGYEAWCPDLPRLAICGYGDTPEEALVNLKAVKQERFTHYHQTGIPIPKPTKKGY